MTIVVDASVAVKWVLPEPDSEAAVALRNVGEDLIAPSLILAEVGNALWKSALRGDVAQADAAEALRLAVEHLTQITPLEELAARATEIAIDLRHPIYDCFYLALAERERCVLISADQRLLAAAKKMKSVRAQKL